MRASIICVASLSTAIALFAIPKIACGDMVYNGFGTTAGLTLNGSAAVAHSSDGTVLRLTPTQPNMGGSVFSTVPVSTEKFTSIFSFRITDPGGPLFDGNTSNGADGLAFVVQNVANNVGTTGEGIGYQGLSPSIGITYDTWHNPENNDPSQNYVGIDINGNVVHGPSNGPTVTLPAPELGAGDRWWSWVVYDSQNLAVYLLNSESAVEPPRPGAPILSLSGNLQALLGQGSAFAGFTSATGSDWENHDLLYWRYTPVPEPSTLALLGIGLMASLCRLLRRRSE